LRQSLSTIVISRPLGISGKLPFRIQVITN
jgi:hypothetical protein